MYHELCHSLRSRTYPLATLNDHTCRSQYGRSPRHYRRPRSAARSAPSKHSGHASSEIAFRIVRTRQKALMFSRRGGRHLRLACTQLWSHLTAQVIDSDQRGTPRSVGFSPEAIATGGIVEDGAGVDDFEVAEATYRAAVARWPAARITLRQGARVVHDTARQEGDASV